MFKFLKEYIIAPMKEGVTEARQEIAQENEKQRELADVEKENNRLRQAENKRRIMVIPYSEKFATALAAPFRATYLSPWPPFGTDGQNKDIVVWPVCLYSFGETDSIPDEKRAVLKDCLARDLNITDKESALTAIASYLYARDISKKLPYNGNKVPHSLYSLLAPLEKTPGDGGGGKAAGAVAKLRTQRALLSCMMAYAVTGSADCNYLNKGLALELLDDISVYVKSNYSDWKVYGDEFLAGEKMAKLNNALGRSFLRKFVGYLNTMPGSPWLNINGAPAAEPAVH